MPAGGKLSIQVDRACLPGGDPTRETGVAPGDYVRITVSDTGVGIPNHLVERVFEPFFTTKDKSKGTGLGLSMVYGFIKQLGGHVSVHSNEGGGGTTVRMYLPLVDEQDTFQANGSSNSSAESAGEATTVLIVDDKDDVRQIGVTMLEQLNCRVIAAADAAEALRLLNERDDTDILFTDVVMPGGMSGVTLAAEARRRQPHLKVLFCSGYVDEGLLNSSELLEGAVFVRKPYGKSELALKLERVRRSRKES